MNKKIISYVVIVKDCNSELERTVREELKHGWQPFGGVSMTVAKNGNSGLVYQYAQAMVVYAD